jgi:glycosyltransferase involved in cell wall biosynthesis
MHMKIPIIIVGDAPTQPTGLARIARDLAELIATSFAEQVELHFVGYQPAGGSWAGWNGDYPLWCFSDLVGWGQPVVARVIEVLRAQGHTRGIVWPIWDAERAYELAADHALPSGWELWLYPAIDAVDTNGSFYGPARAAIRRADRVVAYGAWAAQILEGIRRHQVEAIPHGLHDAWYLRTSVPSDHGALRIGCVATNQARKDLPLFFRVLQVLIERGHRVHGWLHTNQLLGAYSVHGLIAAHRLSANDVMVSLSNTATTDAWMRQMYRSRDLTLGVGRGEGFGYPAIESMSQGVPHLAVNYAGGAEILPAEWRIEPAAWTVDGPYSLRRPIMPAGRVADLIEAVRVQPDRREVAYSAAMQYHWTVSGLHQRWMTWIKDGLDQLGGTRG